MPAISIIVPIYNAESYLYQCLSSLTDQNLKNNSYLSFINTTVYRFGEDYDANVSAMEFDLRTKDNASSKS
jgi:GT2 family glycosyltransferase